MLKPACPKCRRFFRPKQNGYYFIEGMPVPGVTKAPPGTEAPEEWQPYKLWVGDLWECQGCGAEIVVGALRPVSEHYMPGFREKIAFATEYEKRRRGSAAEVVQINDC